MTRLTLDSHPVNADPPRRHARLRGTQSYSPCEWAPNTPPRGGFHPKFARPFYWPRVFLHVLTPLF